MKSLIFFILAILFLAAVLLKQACRTLPLRELRRRARSGHDKPAAAIYKIAAYGEGFEVLAWLVGSLSASALILMAASYDWWLASGLIMLAGFYIFVSRPPKQAGRWQWRLAARLAPLASVVLSLLQPVLGRIGSLLKGQRATSPASGLYEKEDLLELLKAQRQQSDSRFSELELAIVRGALSFGDKAVGQVMLPRSKLKLVAATEAIGPMLMDELHKTGQTRFLVVKEVTKSADLQILGTLYIKDLLERLEQKGSVRDIMHAGPGYINESQSLRQALEAFLKTHQHLLVVVNNFEEISGALAIEDVLQQILGQKLTSEFEHYDDLSAVAGLQNKINQ